MAVNVKDFTPPNPYKINIERLDGCFDMLVQSGQLKSVKQLIEFLVGSAPTIGGKNVIDKYGKFLTEKFNGLQSGQLTVDSVRDALLKFTNEFNTVVEAVSGLERSKVQDEPEKYVKTSKGVVTPPVQRRSVEVKEVFGLHRQAKR